MSPRVAAFAAAFLMLPVAPASAQELDFGTPTPAQLANSVTTFTIAGSIRVWPLEGSVNALESEEKEGSTTTVTLGSDVLFAFGSASLSPRVTATVDALAARLPAGGEVRVDGHTDSVGSDADNLVLSRARAQAVAARLKQQKPGITTVVTGHGEEQPVASNGSASNDNPEGRAKNRRVEIRFTS